MDVIEARDLYRFFHAGDDEVLALRGVSLDVAAGEMVAVVGPSGSGKSTLLTCLAGLDEPDGGVVRVCGNTITRRPETRRAALRARFVGVLFQSDNLLAHLTVAENVALVRRLESRPGRTPVAELLRSLGIEEQAGRHPSQLSGGEAVRAGLAVALANDPPVLLADEPTGEVDAVTEARIVELLMDRAADGAAVLVVTHSDAVAAAASRVVALADGRVAS